MKILHRLLGHDDDKPCKGYGCPRAGTVVTSPRAPTHGELAWSLACGANMSVHNGRAWNLLVDPHMPVENLRGHLEMWGIHSPTDWHVTLRRLFEGQYGERAYEEALGLRRQLWDHHGLVPTLVDWQRATATPEHAEIARRVLAYERAFTADGLVPPFGAVRSVLAYDWGRAVHVALWGVATGLVDAPTAESAIRHAGALCADGYASWADLSAGYGLGRALAYDDDEFGDEYYRSNVVAHAALSSAAASPWNTIRWPSHS